MKVKKIEKIFTHSPQKNRKIFVGMLHTLPDNTLLFVRRVKRHDHGKSKKHYFDLVKGYSIQKDVFDKYLRGKKGRIGFMELDTGNFLVASIDTWMDNASYPSNWGDGKQVALSEKFMHNSDLLDRNTTEAEDVDEKEYWEHQKKILQVMKKALKE